MLTVAQTSAQRQARSPDRESCALERGFDGVPAWRGHGGCRRMRTGGSRGGSQHRWRGGLEGERHGKGGGGASIESATRVRRLDHTQQLRDEGRHVAADRG